MWSWKFLYARTSRFINNEAHFTCSIGSETEGAKFSPKALIKIFYADMWKVFSEIVYNFWGNFHAARKLIKMACLKNSSITAWMKAITELTVRVTKSILLTYRGVCGESRGREDGGRGSRGIWHNIVDGCFSAGVECGGLLVAEGQRGMQVTSSEAGTAQSVKAAEVEWDHQRFMVFIIMGRNTRKEF